MTDAWREAYERKFITAEEAAHFVKSGDTVVFTAGREAFAIGLAIAARKEELRDVTVFAGTPSYDFGWYDEGWQDSFSIRSVMPTATCQEAVDARRIHIVPLPIAGGVTRNPEIVVTEVSPPDSNGFCSFGQSLWNKKAQLREGRLKIAEVNSSLIRTYGDNFIHVSEIDYFVEHVSSGLGVGSGTLAGRARKEPEPYLTKIVQNVSELIKDGDTIQIGVGRTTEPLVRLGLLEGKRDLGIHSEATPPGVIGLVRQGVINGSRKTINKGKVTVTSLGGGSKEEMDWASNNPLFDLIDVEELEDIGTIGANDNMVAINNALVVQLDGQIGAESVGRRLLATAGGQLAFVMGAWMSRGGRSITVLPSMSRDNSRLVSTFETGTVVTIPRNLADYVVTEYGVASLRGKSLKERAQELIAIAHPDIRAELKKEAAELF
ncbi:MAG: 4-hydroxybutyrate CoA transferase [Chloroflexota bacterium]|nr:MAG: 4-hydroxybutyrate CoA transferase [Chloroflexota bacterium]